MQRQRNAAGVCSVSGMLRNAAEEEHVVDSVEKDQRRGYAYVFASEEPIQAFAVPSPEEAAAAATERTNRAPREGRERLLPDLAHVKQCDIAQPVCWICALPFLHFPVDVFVS